MSLELLVNLTESFEQVLKHVCENQWDAFHAATKQSGVDPYTALTHLLTRIAEQELACSLQGFEPQLLKTLQVVRSDSWESFCDACQAVDDDPYTALAWMLVRRIDEGIDSRASGLLRSDSSDR